MALPAEGVNIPEWKSRHIKIARPTSFQGKFIILLSCFLLSMRYELATKELYISKYFQFPNKSQSNYLVIYIQIELSLSISPQVG